MMTAALWQAASYFEENMNDDGIIEAEYCREAQKANCFEAYSLEP